MKIPVEISRPHYHPSHETAKDLKLTKKRDLSVYPHWVANERVEHNDKSYAVVMPPRDAELWEDRQEVHIHMPSIVWIELNGRTYKAKVKVYETAIPGHVLDTPVVHFDDFTADKLGIKSGDGAFL